jgi:phosphoglycolate phosphatase-like HAD superfamily hydrolase
MFALDFDGVICDSSREIFLVTLRTCVAIDPASDAANPLDQCQPCPDGGNDFSTDPFYQRFVELLPLGNGAEDFAVAIKAVMSGQVLSDQAAYNRYAEQQNTEWKAAFPRAFYEQRAALRAENETGWLGLHGTWPEVSAMLKTRAGSVPYAICTAKDAVSVRKLLDHFGIGDLFPDRLILDKETGAEKTAHLTELARRTGVDFSRITFVDDKVSHLQKAAPLGVRCVLAGWGDNGEREHVQARQDGFDVADLSNVESVFFGPGES